MSDKAALRISLNESYEEVFLGGNAFHQHDAAVAPCPVEENGTEAAGIPGA